MRAVGPVLSIPLFLFLFSRSASDIAALPQDHPTQERPDRRESLSEAQRRLIDAVLGEKIAQFHLKIEAAYRLKENIALLAERHEKWQGDKPALRIGDAVDRCSNFLIPFPASITEKVIDDILWQHDHPVGEDRWKREHRSTCLAALVKLRSPKAIPLILRALEDDCSQYRRGFVWYAFSQMPDKRHLPAVEKHVRVSNTEEMRYAIRGLVGIGDEAVPILRRLVDRCPEVSRIAIFRALRDMKAPQYIPALEDFLDSKIPNVAASAKASIRVIRLLEEGRLYVSPRLVSEDEERLKLLTWEAVSYNERASAKAAAAVVSIGKPAIPFLRKALPSGDHGYGLGGPIFPVTERAAHLLARIGEPAVPGLIDALLEYGGHSMPYVAKALQSITGETHGQSFERWRDWYVNHNK